MVFVLELLYHYVGFDPFSYPNIKVSYEINVELRGHIERNSSNRCFR